MPPRVFELTIPKIERPQTHTVDRAATGISTYNTFIVGSSSQARKVEPRTAKYYLSYDLCYCYIGGVIIPFNDDVLRNIAVVSTHVSTREVPVILTVLLRPSRQVLREYFKLDMYRISPQTF